MGPVGEIAQAQQIKQTAKAEHQKAEHKNIDAVGQPHIPRWQQATPDQTVAQQTEHHTGHTAEKTRPRHRILQHIGTQRAHQHQQQHQQTIINLLDAPADFPEPQHIEHQVQNTEVQEHGRQQPPVFATGQGHGQIHKIDFIAHH